MWSFSLPKSKEIQIYIKSLFLSPSISRKIGKNFNHLNWFMVYETSTAYSKDMYLISFHSKNLNRAVPSQWKSLLNCKPRYSSIVTSAPKQTHVLHTFRFSVFKPHCWSVVALNSSLTSVFCDDFFSFLFHFIVRNFNWCQTCVLESSFGFLSAPKLLAICFMDVTAFFFSLGYFFLTNCTWSFVCSQQLEEVLFFFF